MAKWYNISQQLNECYVLVSMTLCAVVVVTVPQPASAEALVASSPTPPPPSHQAFQKCEVEEGVAVFCESFN